MIHATNKSFIYFCDFFSLSFSLWKNFSHHSHSSESRYQHESCWIFDKKEKQQKPVRAIACGKQTKLLFTTHTSKKVTSSHWKYSLGAVYIFPLHSRILFRRSDTFKHATPFCLAGLYEKYKFFFLLKKWRKKKQTWKIDTT